MTMSKFDPHKHHRRSIRLPGYDYASAGGYFVTVVTWQRECLFGNIINNELRLNKVGKIVEWEWLELPKRLSYISLGAYAVMPNHFHGILFMREHAVGATHQGPTSSLSSREPLQTVTNDDMDGSPLRQTIPHDDMDGSPPRQTIPHDDMDGSPLRPNGPKPASLGAILAQFKSRATKRIWKIPQFKETPIWQRNYYERIIRDENALRTITDYVEANPLLWEKDDENPNRQG